MCDRTALHNPDSRSSPKSGSNHGKGDAPGPGPLIGIDIDAEPDYVEKHVKRLARETCAKLGISAPADNATIIESGYAGQAYGIPTEGMVAAVERLAREEGILLDPVYTGKAMAGLIDMVEKGRFEKTDNVVFLHTGGSPGLFAYRDAFEK